MARRKKSRGFTLIELMVTVAVVGIVAAAVAPAIGDILADHRQANAANEALRILRRARSEAIGSGAAQLVRFANVDTISTSDTGDLRAWRGMNWSCRHTPWASTTADAQRGTVWGWYMGMTLAAYNDVATTQLASGDASQNTVPMAADDGRQVIIMRAQWSDPAAPTVLEATTFLDICFQPNGKMFMRQLATDPLRPQAGPAVLSVTRSVDDNAHGAAREILLPVGGNPRLR